MLEGLYTAAAGMAAQQDRMDAAANDMANASTTGYKPVRIAFRDLVYAKGGPGAAKDVPLGAGAAATAIGRSTQQGAMAATGQPLDVALAGPAFLAIRNAAGRPALTRDGALRINNASELTTHSGQRLDPPVRLPAGTEPADVKIDGGGAITVAGRQVGTLRLVTVAAPSALQGGQDNSFTATTASGAIRAAAAGTTITQGSLEASGTDASTAMTDMLEAQRSFELASRAIQMQDQALEMANGVKH